MSSSLIVHGAREHNLKDISLELPRGALVVVSGVSGSGKSSLVFDTIYQESRRRFLETLPTYVLQFMERLPRPEVDLIEGLSPAVAVEQRNPVNTSRSTVGTITEIYDYLRLLFARSGGTVCPGCGAAVERDHPESVADQLEAELPGIALTVAFEPPRSEKIAAATLRESLLALGFIRVLQGPQRELLRLDDPDAAERLDPAAALFVAVDRLRLEPEGRTRLTEALATAFHHGEGFALVLPEGGKARRFSAGFHCAACDRSFPEPTPNLFSFNSSYGACPACKGFGNLLDYDPARIVPDPGRSLTGGALDPWTKPRYVGRRERLESFCAARGIDRDRPWRELPAEQREWLLEGARGFEGVLPFLRALERKKYKQYIRFFLRSYQSERTCPECGGGRLRPEAGQVLLGGRSISELTASSVEALRAWLRELIGGLAGVRREAALELVPELDSRLDYLLEVGLGYLTLGRLTRTLSGGEYQRIMLTRLLGSGLTDTLFVLDEPTIGLHQRDTRRLIAVLRRLVAAGNSLLVVEHDREVIAAADYVVELGPGSGEEGGQLLFSGPARLFARADTATARIMREPEPRPSRPRREARRFLAVRGASLHNLRQVDAEFGLGLFNCVTGVSGSGKSSLVSGVLRPAAEALLSGRSLAEARVEALALEGWEQLEEVVVVSQAPIGRTPRSNPVTYVKAFDGIRKLFAAAPEAKALGLTAGDFSFNTAGGRCERCQGAGFELVEMQFLADVLVPCEACEGKRFGPKVLRTRFQGLAIDRVLELTVNEAIGFFGARSGVGKPLWVLQSVGLGYLRLGQSATTLSGGESQRLKIARQLIESGAAARRSHRGKLFLLDEPTTGLHTLEVRRLLKVLDRLVEAGHTVVVVEHHPEVIAHADRLVDLGPDGGERGGRVIFQGPPAGLARCRESRTGAVLNGSGEDPDRSLRIG